jgi:hypothetical protein
MFANNRLRNNVASIDYHIDIMLSRISEQQDGWSQEVQMLDLAKYAFPTTFGSLKMTG